MTKHWRKIAEGKYSLSMDDQEIGTMEVVLNSADTRAIVKIGIDEITIRRTGFWKNNIEVTNKNNEVVAHVYQKKWYANTFWLDYNNKKYTLLVRNNPLAEWAITYNNRLVLAYGLNAGNENGMVNVKISGSENEQIYLLDFILWYLFFPIAMENMGDNFSFQMLLDTQ